MSNTKTSQAIEKVDASPKALVKTYQDSFISVLPSHITKPESWIRLAQAALKKGKVLNNGQTELEVAAANNPPIFLAALLDCARQGLEPGTDEYYLTARKVKGVYQILGITGYQGYIELMYRAGAVDSVVAEVVHANDSFQFRPGRDDIPVHEIDWDAPDRGPLRLTYAFARMKGGATSKVVVLNRGAISKIRAKSPSSDSQYSPWNTDEPSMWLKSSVRQLRKWVPTSAEYRRELLRAERETAVEELPAASEVGPDLPAEDGAPENIYSDDQVIDAELVENGYADDDPERPM